jgi:peptide alpha-N-acetyltransferase
MKDLALLQIQMRDLAGFAQTQHQILEIKPNLKVSWLAFALGKHMKGDGKGAIAIIDTFLSTLENGSVDLQKSYETSELALYKNSIIAENGNWKEALDHLHECKKKDILVDQLSYLKLSGYYQLQLKLYNLAKESFFNLLERGSTEDYSVHTGYMLSILNIDGEVSRTMLKRKGARALSSMLVLSNDQQKTLKEAYQNVLIERFPKSIATKRIMLTLFDVDSEDWNTSVNAYIRASLIRGVPSLGDDLSSFFIIPATSSNKNEYAIAKDAVDVKSHVAYKSIAALVDTVIASLESTSMFPGDDDVQPPSTLLWTWYLRSVLYEKAGDYSNAIAVVDKGLDQTPTGVDLYELKARLLKSAGDINAAVKCVDTGRELDKQDRYINNQTTKYLLQANKEVEALETIALFARHESDPEQNIFDMQVTWYELELAACLARKGYFGKSLKKYCKCASYP